MSSALRRSAGALALAVFLLRVLAPEVGPACGNMGSMGGHGASAAASASAAAAIVAHDAHHDAGEPARATTAAPVHDHGASAAVAEAERPAAPDEHDAPCDCSAWCCCLPTMTRPPTSLITVAATVVTLAEPTAWASTSTSVLRVDRLLPFATAPPRA